MKKLLPAVLLLLFVPLLIHAQNSLDQAKNLNNALNSGGDGSAGYIQDQYLNGNNNNGNNAASDNGSGGSLPGGGAAIGSTTTGKGSGIVAGDTAAVGTETQNPLASLQAEANLRAKRQKALTLYCLSVLAAAIAASLLVQFMPPLAKAAALAVFAGLVIAGLAMVFKGYSDGVNPSADTKIICTLMLASVPLLLINTLAGIPALALGLFSLTQNKQLADFATSHKSSGSSNKNPNGTGGVAQGAGGSGANGPTPDTPDTTPSDGDGTGDSSGGDTPSDGAGTGDAPADGGSAAGGE
ncbi:MAG: hypothetical protein FWF35_00580 [Elusimicrobia bacterium]|nr:hypothetical protein [Elusimicrobiota bacterium]